MGYHQVQRREIEEEKCSRMRLSHYSWPFHDGMPQRRKGCLLRLGRGEKNYPSVHRVSIAFHLFAFIHPLASSHLPFVSFRFASIERHLPL